MSTRSQTKKEVDVTMPAISSKSKQIKKETIGGIKSNRGSFTTKRETPNKNDIFRSERATSASSKASSSISKKKEKAAVQTAAGEKKPRCRKAKKGIEGESDDDDEEEKTGGNGPPKKIKRRTIGRSFVRKIRNYIKKNGEPYFKNNYSQFIP